MIKHMILMIKKHNLLKMDPQQAMNQQTVKKETENHSLQIGSTRKTRINKMTWEIVKE